MLGGVTSRPLHVTGRFVHCKNASSWEEMGLTVSSADLLGPAMVPHQPAAEACEAAT